MGTASVGDEMGTGSSVFLPKGGTQNALAGTEASNVTVNSRGLGSLIPNEHQKCEVAE